MAGTLQHVPRWGSSTHPRGREGWNSTRVQLEEPGTLLVPTKLGSPKRLPYFLHRTENAQECKARSYFNAIARTHSRERYKSRTGTPPLLNVLEYTPSH